MITLALESTAKTASVAIAKDGKVLYVSQSNNGLTHSEQLLPMAEQALKTTHLTVDDVSLLSCTLGPGSFTGVRIATSMIKGFALGKDIPAVGVSTLHSLAQNLMPLCGIFCPVMDARREQVYTALFSSDGKTLTRLTEDTAISLEELAKKLEAYSELPIYFVGDGYEITHRYMQNTAVKAKETPMALIWQNAASTAILAEKLYSEGKGVSAKELMPTYLRLPQAERERLAGTLHTPTVE